MKARWRWGTRSEIGDEGGVLYASAIASRCLLLMWSVETGSRDRIEGRMRT